MCAFVYMHWYVDVDMFIKGVCVAVPILATGFCTDCADGHTASNIPDLFRPLKSNDAGLG